MPKENSGDAGALVCAICGRQIKKVYNPPHPLSGCLDHIIPVSMGGDPLSPDNLQHAHRSCSRKKKERFERLQKSNEHNTISVFNRMQ